uniref:acireductone dioxygenase (Fe(2+)-requiring) n=1 Tax=Ditylenchus dipsaci TaxID=166011 RepID=A0A915EL65_9BILA
MVGRNLQTRGYNYKDEIVEHLHTDEEVRYIVDGAGYFDVRNAKEEWIRILCEPGDLIYCQKEYTTFYCCSQCSPLSTISISIIRYSIFFQTYLNLKLLKTHLEDYIRAVRLFKGEPVWTPYNRSATTDRMDQRLAYKSSHNLIA